MSSTMFNKPLDTEFVGKVNEFDERVTALSEHIVTHDHLEINVNGTTDSLGDIGISNINSDNYVPVSFVGITPANTFMFYMFGVYNKTYFIKFYDDNGNKLTGTAITGKLVYQKR